MVGASDKWYNNYKASNWNGEEMPIKRPPFKFKISPDFEQTINALVDAIEQGNHARQCGLEQDVWTYSRELPEGSEEEEWILDYYYDRGWENEQ